MKRMRVAAVAALALGLTSAGLAGCSEELPEPPAPETTDEVVEAPNLDAEQVKTVLEDVMAVVAQGDEARDIEVLQPRVKAPAITLKSGFYKLAEIEGTDVSGLDINADAATVTQNDSWPRAIVAPTNAGEDELPIIVFVTQDTARDDYKLENWVRLFPGETVQTVSVSEGAPVVAADDDHFMLSPQEALNAWTARLDGAKENADLFDEDEFTKNYKSERANLKEALGENGEATFKATPGSSLTAVELVDGSALVATSISYTVTYKETNERANIKVGGTAAEYMEDPEVGESPVEVTYLSTVMLKIPPKGSEEKISAIGAERVIQSVKRL